MKDRELKDRIIVSIDDMDKFEQKEMKEITEPATRGVLQKKAFLKISQNSQEYTCARVSFLIKLPWILQNF